MRRLRPAALALFIALAVLPAHAQTEPPSVERGQELWGKCQACHTIQPNGRNLVGPALYGVFGRVAGSLPGYRYSEAMKQSGMVWTDENLDRYLAATQDVIPGSKMYGGLAIDQDRVDLLAWMRQMAGPAKP
jgi:cytochrome c